MVPVVVDQAAPDGDVGRLEVVVDVRHSGGRDEAAVGPEQVDVSGFVGERIVDLDPLPRTRHHSGGIGIDRSLATGVAGHEDDFVVGIEGRDRVGAHPGQGVRVHLDHREDRRGGGIAHVSAGRWIEGAQVDRLALVNLDRDLRPVSTVVAEGDDVPRGDSGQIAGLAAFEHHRVRAPAGEAGLCLGRGSGQAGEEEAGQGRCACGSCPDLSPPGHGLPVI